MPVTSRGSSSTTTSSHPGTVTSTSSTLRKGEDKLPGNLFQVLTELSVRRSLGIKDVIAIAQQLGKEHGEKLNSLLKSRARGAQSQNSNGATFQAMAESRLNGRLPRGKRIDHTLTHPTAKVEIHKNHDSSPIRSALSLSESIEQNQKAEIELYGVTILLGENFSTKSARRAKDQATIRAYGPRYCMEHPDTLIHPLETYAQAPLDTFTQYDSVLRRWLFGTEWTGVKDIDFSCLMTRAPTSRSLTATASSNGSIGTGKGSVIEDRKRVPDVVASPKKRQKTLPDNESNISQASLATESVVEPSVITPTEPTSVVALSEGECQESTDTSASMILSLLLDGTLTVDALEALSPSVLSLIVEQFAQHVPDSARSELLLDMIQRCEISTTVRPSVNEADAVRIRECFRNFLMDVDF